VVTGYDWFQPSDLPALFQALQKASRPAILVGGQSLTFWVDYFNIPVPKGKTPYLTQDADVLATKHDARIFATELHGTSTFRNRTIIRPALLSLLTRHRMDERCSSTSWER